MNNISSVVFESQAGRVELDLQKEERTIDSYAKEYLEGKRDISTLKKDLADHLDSMDAVTQIRELKKQIKELQNQVDNNTEVTTLKEKIKDKKERNGLVGEILTVKMKEQQLTLIEGQTVSIECDGYKFVLLDKLKVKRITE